MLHTTLDEVEMKRPPPGPLAGTKVDDTSAQASYPPIFAPYEPRAAVLMVMPDVGTSSEVSLHLGAAGYDVWAASDGCLALEIVEQTPPDLILVDLDGMYEINQCGKISGFRILHLLGRVRCERPLAVVVLTSLDYTEVEGPVRASADAFMNKPIAPAQLLYRLQGTLDRVRSRHQQRAVPAIPPERVHQMPVPPAHALL